MPTIQHPEDPHPDRENWRAIDDLDELVDLEDLEWFGSIPYEPDRHTTLVIKAGLIFTFLEIVVVIALKVLA